MVKGLQVAPAELEGALLAHPLVYDAAVVGRPDARAGEMPVAFVVTRLSFFKTGEPVSAAQLRAHLASRLAEYKLPAEADIRFIDAVPKSGSGKILRRSGRDHEFGVDREGQAVGECFGGAFVGVGALIQRDHADARGQAV